LRKKKELVRREIIMIKSDYFDQKINVTVIPKESEGGEKKRSTSCFNNANEIIGSASLRSSIYVEEDFP
jgi:hypothetical protein